MMLVRIVLFLGLALVAFAGGAAGWQYWQQWQGGAVVAGAAGKAAAPAGPLAAMVRAAPPEVEAPAQDWLISPGGGLADRRAVSAFLQQGAFTDDREVSLHLRLPLTALLAEGEALPDPVFAQVFADIRAPVLALDLCRPLLSAWAAGCAPVSARASDYDAETGTAQFTLRLAFTQKPGPLPLPDLAAHVLHGGDLSGEALGPLPDDTPQALLQAAVTAADRACALSENAGRPCRVTGLTLRWDAPGDSAARVQTAWLAPLSPGMYPAPPLY